MSVEIEPQELGFQRPFTTEVSQSLKIRNPNTAPVAFKVKTTAPKQYCVRPNSGRIEAGQEVEVNVLLQAMKQEPPLDAKCRDKFLVQSVAITGDKEFTNSGSIWEHISDIDKASVQEKKIRVVYLPAHGIAAASTPLKNGVNGVNGTETPSDNPPAYTSQRSPSPPEQHFTPDQSSRRSLATPAASAPIKHEEDDKDAIKSALPAAVQPTYEELKAKLADAQATIAGYAQEGGVRMRKAAADAKNNEKVQDLAQKVQVTGNQGVPLQIVAALCLLSFLLAYIFF